MTSARPLPADKRALVSHLVGRAVLARTVEVLEPLGIAVMPLKGLWLQHFVYGAAGTRLITDVDVLVLPERYRDAQQALIRAGWQLRAEEVSESTLFAPGLGLPLDLHRHLYSRGAFRASPQRIFRRATQDRDAFGCPLLLPDPLDVFSHLVGHALKGAGAWRGTGHELHDIPRLLETFQLTPERCAARLHEDGLARAARFVLPRLRTEDDAVSRAILASLPRDRIGATLQHVVRALHQTHADRRHAHTAAGFLLDSSLSRGAYALGLRLMDTITKTP